MEQFNQEFIQNRLTRANERATRTEKPEATEATPQAARSLLGGAISYEFSDCSIAAADLNNSVGEKIQKAFTDGTTVEKHVIGDGNKLQTLVVAEMDYHNDFVVYGRKAKLVLAQRTGTKAEVVEEKTRKWLLPKVVQKTEYTTVLEEMPLLAVSIGQDTLLPLASFARRDGGQCSYVQLGNEMEDDNVYATTADDNSSRHDLIEALREQLAKHNKTRFVDERIAQIDTIQKFIDQQLTNRRAEVAVGFEQQLIRIALEKVETGKEQTFTLLSETGPALPEIYNTSSVIPTTVLPDGRAVKLDIGRPYYATDELSLLAVTRGGITAVVATMSARDQRVGLGSDARWPDAHDGIVRDLYYTIASRPPVYSIDVDQDIQASNSYKPDDLKVDDRLLSKRLHQLDMLSEDEAHTTMNYKNPELDRKLGIFLAYPEPQHSPFPQSAPTELALSRLDKSRIADIDLLNRLQAGKVFSEVLGEARRCDELLMHFVADLALRHETLTARFGNVQTGKTTAGALVAAQATEDLGIYNLRISGRPESMTDEPLKPLLGASLSPTKPYLGLNPESSGIFAEASVEEIVDIVSRVLSANPKQPTTE